MTIRSVLRRATASEELNFILTNRLGRVVWTHFMGWFSKIENPALTRCSMAVWGLFIDLDLSDAKEKTFHSLHACFTRELKEGARPQDTDAQNLTSPSDGMVVACGQVHSGRLFQAKGLSYSLSELMGLRANAHLYDGGCFATLRLTSAMYHRFHAPHAMRIACVDYISGDTWNVNPAALKRVPSLYCRNERAVLHAKLAIGGHRVAIVPIAAVLVASIKLHFANLLLHLRYRGPTRIHCQVSVAKGEELGWFEHGSTIVVLAPPGFSLAPGVVEGACVRVGQALMRLPAASSPAVAG